MLTEFTLSSFSLEALYEFMVLKMDEFQKDENTRKNFIDRVRQREEIELIQQVIDKRKTLSLVN